jgi:CheY-like chemotaxis protein
LTILRFPAAQCVAYSRSAGYTVVEADEGMAALEMYFIEKPVAVLLDLVMKGMYGLDVLMKLGRWITMRVLSLPVPISRALRGLWQRTPVRTPS